jgi:S1-C subfamily serine protease
MSIMRTLSILFTSITTGLAGAFIVVLVNPDLINNQSINSAAVENRPPRINSYATAIERAAPSVVNVFATVLTKTKATETSQQTQSQFYGQARLPKLKTKNSLGSGVAIGDNGYILTNYHVISNAVKIKISNNKGEVVNARIVGVDPDTDIAVL